MLDAWETYALYRLILNTPPSARPTNRLLDAVASSSGGAASCAHAATRVRGELNPMPAIAAKIFAETRSVVFTVAMPTATHYKQVLLSILTDCTYWH